MSRSKSLIFSKTMSTKPSLVFFGNERLATGVTTSTPILKALIYEGYVIEVIVVSNSPTKSRNKRELEVETVAKEYNIPVIKDEKLSNFSAQFAVLAAFGKIIPQTVIDKFPLGIINIHPSLLPKYRGPTPIESTILTGERETGVSLMKLVAKMDAGPVYAQAKIGLSGKETKQELANKLSVAGADLLIKNLKLILDASLQPKEQDESGAIYTALIDKSLGTVDWSLPAEVIERQVRAYTGWPKSRTNIHSQEVIITKARIAADENDGELVTKCGSGYLEIQEIIAPSGRKMSGGDFLRGYSKLR